MPTDLHYVRKSVSSKKKVSTSIEKQMDGCAAVSKSAGTPYEVFCGRGTPIRTLRRRVPHGSSRQLT